MATGASTITATDPTTSIFGTSLVTILPAVLVRDRSVSCRHFHCSRRHAAVLRAGMYSDDTTQDHRLGHLVLVGHLDRHGLEHSGISGSRHSSCRRRDDDHRDGSDDLHIRGCCTDGPACCSRSGNGVPSGRQCPCRRDRATHCDRPLQRRNDSGHHRFGHLGVIGHVGRHGLEPREYSGSGDRVADGASTITATDPTTSIEGVSVVTVLPAVLVAVTVSPLASNVPAGETEQYSATGLYSDGTTADLTHSVTWASSDTSAATVSNAAGSRGLVTGVADGASTITATDPTTSIEGVAAVTVLPAVLVTITVSPVEASVALHATEQFAATGILFGREHTGPHYSVTWSSSDLGEARSRTPLARKVLRPGLQPVG